MWARRLVGEALSQAQRVAGERAALTALIAEGAGDQAALQALFKRLTSAHTARMTARRPEQLGLGARVGEPHVVSAPIVKVAPPRAAFTIRIRGVS